MAEISREELKQHCLKEIDACKYFANKDNTSLNDSRLYREHKMVLDMIEKLEKIEKIMNDCFCSQGICLRRCKYIDIADIDNCVAVRRYDEIGKILRGD